MGQKINPKIFRLGLYNNEWDSFYMEKNCEESTLLVYNDLKIREFISRILKLNGLLLHSCKSRYTVEEIYISVYYFRLSNSNFLINDDKKDLLKITNSIYFFLNKTGVSVTGLKIFLKVRDVNKLVKTLIDLRMDYVNKIFRRYLKDIMFEELLNVLVVSLFINNSSRLLVHFLVMKFKSIKNQNKLFFYLKLILVEFIKKSIFKIEGIKLSIKGRFNKSLRSKKKDIVLGSIPLQTIRTKIDYFSSPAFTSVGTFGIKLWICRKV